MSDIFFVSVQGFISAFPQFKVRRTSSADVVRPSPWRNWLKLQVVCTAFADCNRLVSIQIDSTYHIRKKVFRNVSFIRFPFLFIKQHNFKALINYDFFLCLENIWIKKFYFVSNRRFLKHSQNNLKFHSTFRQIEKIFFNYFTLMLSLLSWRGF